MKFLYHKVFNNDSVSFTFKVERSAKRGLPMGKISRSDKPDDSYPDYVIVEGYDIELKVGVIDGLTEVSMVRKTSQAEACEAEDLPAVSDASHRS